MARHVNPEGHAARRREILAAALELMGDKGYERMTIDDVLARTQMSKGALYHYFRSKRALLEGVVELMGESAADTLRGVTEVGGLGAINKLHAYFTASKKWKADHIAAVSTTARLWRDENNALFRQKLIAESMRTVTPMLESIIRQGCSEGVFDTEHPHEVAMILSGIDLLMADAYIDAVRADGSVWPENNGPRLQTLLAAHRETYERILGAPAGSLVGPDAEPG
jgi:AcrR family transcriptional regulator